jgi:hypothetical protein
MLERGVAGYARSKKRHLISGYLPGKHGKTMNAGESRLKALIRTIFSTSIQRKLRCFYVARQILNNKDFTNGR